jgi:hypothetical protein
MSGEAESTPRPAQLASFSDVTSESVPGLDSLLSPVPHDLHDVDTPVTAVPGHSGAEAESNPRDSVAELEQVVESDIRFSNVPLSAHASTVTLDSVPGRDSVGSVNDNPLQSPKSDRRNTIQLGGPGSARSSTLVESTRKRSESASSAHSSGAAPFMLHRLDLQKVQSDSESNKSRHSNALLQEEFNKMHQKDLQAEGHVNANIDWGTSASHTIN